MSSVPFSFFCSFLSQSAVAILFRFCNDPAIHSLHPSFLPSLLRIGILAVPPVANGASGNCVAAAAAATAAVVVCGAVCLGSKKGKRARHSTTIQSSKLI